MVVDDVFRVVDPHFDPKTVAADADQDLYDLQAIFMSMILDPVLKNPHGK